MSVRTFWSSGHVEHDPGRLPQPPGGSGSYYSEVAERAPAILAAIDGVGLGPVVDLADDAVDPDPPEVVGSVHDPAMVAVLRTAFARVAAADGWDPLDDEQVVVAETFTLVGDRSPSRSTSPWADLGRHCNDTSAPLFAGTWRAAVGAARAAVAAADDVAAGSSASYALCRPPGHHAGRSRFGGFCYLNNAALAAARLRDAGRRVAVVDVDLHHGNGTQEVFWDRVDVLYASLHIDPDVEYPFYAGFADETGGRGAEGANLNLPLPEGCDEARYLEALAAAVGVVRAFGADALVVSLGVDTHAEDPIGRFALPTSTYPRIGSALAALGLPTVAVQEGGYHLPTLGESVVGVLSAFA